jgi:branched-subunit amino acid aminotransferase/4-amino-4-deoxychorismate lyase
MSAQSIYRWAGGALVADEGAGAAAAAIVAADSWLVADSLVLALALHRDRFLAAASPVSADAERFWDAAIATIPRTGEWFPRVEVHSNAELVLRLRSAPPRERSVAVATWMGAEPRTVPTIKGPDLERMAEIRAAVQPDGAGEAILLTPDGYVVEGAYSGLLWWRGEILCGPLTEFDRVDSVTARSVLTLARAFGFDTHEEAVTPNELDGVELWALSALHGIRIVTNWVDGPSLAEQPGRLATWRARLEALRRPLP